MAGNIGEGIQYELIFDMTTFTTGVRRNHIVKYTGVDHTCETYDSGALQSAYTLSSAMAFAGVVFVDFPYVEMSAALTAPYGGTNLSVNPTVFPSGVVSTANMVTVLHRCRTYCIPAEDITAGQVIGPANVADGVTQKHDGMVSPSDTGTPTAAEMYAVFGIAETAGDVAASHDTHPWDQNNGDYGTEHPAIWVQLWR